MKYIIRLNSYSTVHKIDILILIRKQTIFVDLNDYQINY